MQEKDLLTEVVLKWIQRLPLLSQKEQRVVPFFILAGYEKEQVAPKSCTQLRG